MGHRDDRQHYAEFKALIDELRRDRQLRWIVTTGRHYGGYRSYTSSLERAGIYPDLLVTARNRVFGRHGKGYRVKPAYTAQVMAAVMLGHVRGRRTLKQMHHHLSNNVQGVRRVLQLPDRFTLRFATLEAATESMRWIRQRIRDLPTLKAQQVERELSVVQIACRKGNAVRVLSARLGVSRDEILTIGDSRTDRCFLDRRVAFHTGCPLNADDETREIVHNAKGHLSTKFSMAGSIDVIRATLDGTVSSEIPPVPEDMPRRRRTGGGGSHTRSRDSHHLKRSYILGGAIAAITLVVFASFGVLPFSELIMKPVHLLFRLFSGIFSLFS
jgi:hypothetical protein